MADGGFFLKINDIFCCKFNLSVRHLRSSSPSGGMYNPDGLSGGGTGLYLDNPNPSGNFRYTDDIFFLGTNVTWADVRQITSNFTEGVRIYCDVNDSSHSHNLSDVNLSIVSLEDHLGSVIGDRYVSTAAVVILTILYTFIFLTGILGNVCTCIVITRNRFLHTATNYYLFNLAICDILTLLLGK